MKKVYILFVLIFLSINLFAIDSNSILARIKTYEKDFTSMQADLKPTGSKNKLSKMEKKLDILADVKDGKVKYKKGNRIKIEGKLQGIKVSAVENNYKIRFNVGPLKGSMDYKDDPGKRYNSLDLCFLSSWLWENNKVTVLSVQDGVAKCKFDPIQGGNEERHDLVWIDTKTLKMLRREKYNTDGILKLIIVYNEWKELIPGYYIATKYHNYNPQKELIGVNTLVNIKVNVPISDDIFKI